MDRRESNASPLQRREHMMSVTPSTIRPETPLTEDPLLATTMVPPSGEGENSMKYFIQEHMTSILQPLAETVTEIQRSLKQLREDHLHTNGLAERNADHIQSHEQKLMIFGSGMNRINEDIQAYRTELHEVMEKLVSVEGEMDMTKVSLGKCEGYCQATAGQLQDTRKLVNDIDERLRQTQLSVSETNVAHTSFIDRLSEMRSMHDGLNDRHMQMMTTLQQLRQSDENTRAAFKRHEITNDKQKKDAQRSFAIVEDRLKSVEAMLLDTTHKTQHHAKNLKTMSADIKHVLTELGEVVGVQQGMTGVKSEGTDKKEKEASPAERFGNRMTRIEESIAAMNRYQAAEKDNSGVWRKELDEAIKKNSSETRDNALHLENIAKQTRSQEERLLRNDTKLAQAEGNLEKVFKMADKNDQENREIKMNLRDLSSAVEFQSNKNDQTAANLKNNSQDLDNMNADLQLFSKDFVDMQASIGKIGMRLELAHEYFQGTCKGFQDINKRVTAGLDGMVAPRTSTTRKALPEIPGIASRSSGKTSARGPVSEVPGFDTARPQTSPPGFSST